jgi:glycosyltransferase involved in cell wall biosynthesis
MRIAQFVSARVMNGAARHCLTLSEALARRGHQILLVHRPDLGARPEHPAVACIESGFGRAPAELGRIGQRLAAFDADVVHTHMSSAHSYGALLRLWLGVPTVATAHARHFQLHWLCNDWVIAPSRSTAAFHRRVNLLLHARLEVIPNFVDCAAITPATARRRAAARQRLGLNDEALVIGSVADITANKRPSHIVAAARSLLEARSDAVLLFAGAELDAEEARRVREEAGAFTDRVRLLGRRADVAELLAAFDIFALASRSEEAPMCILEAMAAGLPVVSTDVGGIGELVRPDETGFLVAADDVEAFGERLQRLAGDPALRAGLGEAGRRRVRETFAEGPIVARVEDVLAAAAARRPDWNGRLSRPPPLAPMTRG